ncbi:DUF3823 domain-containing protein [Chitinophaga sp. LS1]|uniref:DUF3823 domain-containing protein n=1 Tax=Chitinophaga sp. LS1 TaxID=3051176 RepID=UPI002AAA8024|nr:DUF3823 domain-containing protein [Chitinophaga sp. LS1]WPV68322.1 DUF3823 domain-containing protein [Chitinophaga sp. LS1]
MFRRKYITGLLIAMTAFACKKDNYDEPKTIFKGSITYQGEAINVASLAVYFELWEPGWGKSGAIAVQIQEDGSFSSLLFNGNYKLIIPAGQGPFRSVTNNATNSDTIPLNLTGSTTMNIEVMPYYMIRNQQIAKSGTTAAATFKLEQIITDANARSIENVYLYLNQTTIVDQSNYKVRTALAGSSITDLNNVAMSVDIPASMSSVGTTGAQNYAYARIGVKIAGVEDLLYSTIVKIDL